jgi:putative effector of murein hydrolase
MSKNPMSEKAETLELKIKRVRTRLAAGVKTGSGAASHCLGRTDPTENGYECPTGAACPSVLQCGFNSVGDK